MKNKYHKTTQGLSAQVFVAKATAYTDDATYGDFVKNAVDGEMGVFLVYDDSTSTTYKEFAAVTNAADTALQPKDKFFIAQKRDKGIHKSLTFTYEEMSVRQVDYTPFVRQVTNVGFNGSSGSLNSGTFVAGQIFPVSVIETTPANQPFPKWSYEETSRTGDTLVSLAAKLRKQMNDDSIPQNRTNPRITSVDLLTNGTTAAFSVASGNVTFTNNSTEVTATGHNAVAGDYIRVADTAAAVGAADPLYKVVSVEANKFEIDTPYQGATITHANLDIPTRIVKITAVTEVGFKLTALEDGVHFRLAVQEDMANADVVYTTGYKEGIGTSEQVAELEKEGEIFDGRTTVNIAFEEDYGTPTSYTVPGTTYKQIYLDYQRTMKSVAAPKILDNHLGHVILALPTGVAPTTALDGMFV